MIQQQWLLLQTKLVQVDEMKITFLGGQISKFLIVVWYSPPYPEFSIKVLGDNFGR